MSYIFDDDCDEKIILRIKKLEARCLKNVESSWILGHKNDPYAIVNFSTNSWGGTSYNSTGIPARTSTNWGAGSEVIWNLETDEKLREMWTISTTRDIVETNSLKISIFDKNNLSSDVLIGAAEVSIAADFSCDCDIEINNLLYDASGKKSGEIFVSLVVGYYTMTEGAKVSSMHGELLCNDDGLGKVAGSVEGKSILPSLSSMLTSCEATSRPIFESMPSMNVNMANIPSFPHMSMPEMMSMPSMPNLFSKMPTISGVIPPLTHHHRVHSHKDNTHSVDSTNFCIVVAFMSVFGLSLALSTSQFFFWAISVISSNGVDRTDYRLLFGRMFAAIQTVLLCAVVYLVAHRLLGYIASLLLRRYLCTNIGKEPGSYNIHIGWVSYRGLLDKNEIVLGEVVWRNHGHFKHTPFFIYVKEISVSLSLRSVYDFIWDAGVLKFDRVVLDTVEIHIETEGTATYPLNLYAAIGIQIEANTMAHSIHKFIGKIIETLGLSDPALNVLKSVETSAKEEASAKLDDKTEMLVEVSSLIILDVIAHPLDLLSTTHMKASHSTDLQIHHVVMLKKDLTKESKSGDSTRQPVSWVELGGLIQGKLVDALVAENKVKIAAMLSATSANNIMSLFSISK